MITVLPSLRFSERPSFRFPETLSLALKFPSGTFQAGDTFALAVDTDHVFASVPADQLCAFCDTPAIDVGAQTLTFAVDCNTQKMAEKTNGKNAPVLAYVQVIRYRSGEPQTILDDTASLLPIVYTEGDTAPVVQPNIGYTKTQADARFLQKPASGNTGDVLTKTATGEAWQPPVGVSRWEDIEGKPTTIAGYGITDAVEKVSGKGLSSNDYTDTDKAKVGGLAAVATSGSYNDLSNKPAIPSISGLATETYVDNAVAVKITNPSGGSAGQILTKTASGEAWGEVPQSRSVTAIPSATSAMTLGEHQYTHAPAVAPTYTLPAVTDSTKTHTVFLDVDMATTASIAFQDADGNAVTPKTATTPAVGECWTFMAEWQFGAWQVYGIRAEEA